MTSSAVENLTDIATAGGLQGSNLFYVVRSGAPDADFKDDGQSLLTLIEDNATAFAWITHTHTLAAISDAGGDGTIGAHRAAMVARSA